jgi:ATP/ADP translocase
MRTLHVLCFQTSVETLYEWRNVDFKPSKRSKSPLIAFFYWVFKCNESTTREVDRYIGLFRFLRNEFKRVRNVGDEIKNFSKNVNFITYETKSWKFVRRRATKARLTTLSRIFVLCALGNMITSLPRKLNLF